MSCISVPSHLCLSAPCGQGHRSLNVTFQAVCHFSQVLLPQTKNIPPHVAIKQLTAAVGEAPITIFFSVYKACSQRDRHSMDVVGEV